MDGDVVKGGREISINIKPLLKELALGKVGGGEEDGYLREVGTVADEVDLPPTYPKMGRTVKESSTREPMHNVAMFPRSVGRGWGGWGGRRIMPCNDWGRIERLMFWPGGGNRQGNNEGGTAKGRSRELHEGSEVRDPHVDGVENRDIGPEEENTRWEEWWSIEKQWKDNAGGAQGQGAKPE